MEWTRHLEARLTVKQNSDPDEPAVFQKQSGSVIVEIQKIGIPTINIGYDPGTCQ